jgi:glycosyltransferase involved in cell wall biosynthesis
VTILILCPIYPPDRSPRAYRWAAIAERWAAEGKRVEIVAIRKPGDARHELRNGVAVYRVGGLIERLRGAFGRASHRAADSQGGAPARPGRALAAMLYRRTLGRLAWPDYAFDWYPAALAKAGALVDAGAVDAMVSVSHPFTPHLVGMALKRRRPELRWLADIGDPFSLADEAPLNNRMLYGGLNRRAERRMLELADAAVVTVERCRADYAAAFPAVAGKLAVIPPLLSLPRPRGEATPVFPAAGQHLLCVGTLYRRLRDPGPLLRLFAALRRRRADLHLHFMGDINDCGPCFAPWQAELAGALHLHGTVPRDRLAAAMQEADALVNIGNATPYQLPSKLVEYVASGRPILNLATSPEDSATAFLAGYPAALTLATDGDAPAPAVEAALSFLAQPPCAAAETVQRFLEPFGIERIAGAYARLLQASGGTASAAHGRG